MERWEFSGRLRSPETIETLKGMALIRGRRRASHGMFLQTILSSW
jgi:hypothetical protein